MTKIHSRWEERTPWRRTMVCGLDRLREMWKRGSSWSYDMGSTVEGDRAVGVAGFAIVSSAIFEVIQNVAIE